MTSATVSRKSVANLAANITDNPYEQQIAFSLLNRCRLFLAYQLFPFIVPCQAVLAACILTLYAAVVQTSPPARMLTFTSSLVLLVTWSVCYVRAVFSRNPSLPSEAWLSAREFDEYMAWKVRYRKALASGELQQQQHAHRKFDNQHQQFVINDPALRQPRFICGRAFLMAAKQRRWITYEMQRNHMKHLPLDDLRDMAAQASPAEFVARVCEQCRAVLPDRAWHCECCNKCVLKLYHHCPLLRNCIAYKNLKIYMLFLGYQLLLNAQTLIACALMLVIMLRPGMPIPVLDSLIGRNPQSPPDSNSFLPIATSTGDGWWGILLLAGTSAPFYALNTAYVAWLLAIHTKWIAQNQTEHEYHRPAFFGSGRFAYSTFDLGSAYKNFTQVFGPNPLLWCAPMNTSVGNGIDYPVRNYAPSSVWNNVGNTNNNTSAIHISVSNNKKTNEVESLVGNFSQNIDDNGAATSSKVERAHLKMLAKEAELSGISADSHVIQNTTSDNDDDSDKYIDAGKIVADRRLGTEDGGERQRQQNVPDLKEAKKTAGFFPSVLVSAFRTIFGGGNNNPQHNQEVEATNSNRKSKAELEAAIRASQIEERQRQQELEKWRRKQHDISTSPESEGTSRNSPAVPVTVIGARTSSPLKRKIECILLDEESSNLADSREKSALFRPSSLKLQKRQPALQRTMSSNSTTDLTTTGAEENDDAQSSSRATTATTARDTEYEADVENNISSKQHGYIPRGQYAGDNVDDDDDGVAYDGGAGSSIIDALSQRSVYEPHSSTASSYFPMSTTTPTITTATTEYETGDGAEDGGTFRYQSRRNYAERQQHNYTNRQSHNNKNAPQKSANKTNVRATVHRRSIVGGGGHGTAAYMMTADDDDDEDNGAAPLDYYFDHNDKQRLFMQA